MDQIETNPDATSAPSANTLQEDVQSLRMIITGALLALIVLSGALDIYLFRQASVMRGQYSDAAKFVEESGRINAVARDLMVKLAEFAKTHPDFEPVLRKYAVTTPSPAPKK